MIGIVWQLDLQLPKQSVPIITKFVTSNPVHGDVYSIQHYVIKFVSDLQHVSGFLRVLRFPLPIKLTATILLIGTDCTSSCKSNYHTITTTTG